MAYGLKYTAEYNNPGGAAVRLSVYQKNYSGSSYVIDNMTGLSLEIGGGSDPIYTPVIKTTVRFSMIDAPDVTPAAGHKCGNWEEFYTNDATKYKVVLSKKNGSSWSDLWAGYVTPDSWQEDLYYHGNIEVTARDMLGALSDIDFDHPGTNGRISVRSLILNAFEKCQAPMYVTLDNSIVLKETTNNTSILDACINVEAFKGRSWWDALTDTLESLGMVLRYVGSLYWVVSSIRYIPDVMSAGTHGCEFLNHSGLRQLDPPVKDITGEFNLDIVDAPVKPLEQAMLVTYGNVATVYNVGGVNAWQDENADGFSLSEPSFGWQATDGTGRFPLFRRSLPAWDGSFDVSANPYFIVNTGQKTLLSKQWNYGQAKTRPGVCTSPCRLVISQDGPMVKVFGNSFMRIDGWMSPVTPALKCVRVYITYDGLHYYDGLGSWVSGTEKDNSADTTSGAIDPVEIPFENGVAELDIVPPSGVSRTAITINVVHVEMDGCADALHPAVYVPLALYIAEPSTSKIPNAYSVKTVYNEANNVRISRTPAIGSVTTQLPGSIFPNALVTSGGNVIPNSWAFPGDTGVPLEVMVQAQLLQMYSASMSLFTGTLRDKSGAADGMATPGYGFSYYTRPCVVLRGTYDFTTGWVRDAAIREVLYWSEVWGSSFNPDYSIVDERISGSAESGRHTGGTASGGGSSSGGGGEWGEASNGFAPLTVSNGMKTVALQGHGHTSAQVSHGDDSLADLIPNAAGDANQLADKAFVNSSIATATATFRGTSAAGLTEQQFLDWAYDLPAYDQNDYIFWNTVDAAGNTQFKRYKFSGASWVYEYTLNNSSFTAEQWAAISSGVTSGLVTKLSELPTAAQYQTAMNNKQDKLTFDDVPTANSNNPVKSSGIKTALDGKADTSHTHNWEDLTNRPTAGNKGLPVFAHPGGTETDPQTGNQTTVKQGQPYPVDHIGTHPELDPPIIIPLLSNDFAYLRTRGGACSVTVNSAPVPAYDVDAMFDNSPLSMEFQGTKVVSGTTYNLALTSKDAIVGIKITTPGMTEGIETATINNRTCYYHKSNWNSRFFIDFGNAWWSADSVTVLVKYGYWYYNNGQLVVVEPNNSDTGVGARQTFTFSNPSTWSGSTLTKLGGNPFVVCPFGSKGGYGVIEIDITLTGFHPDTSESSSYKFKPRVSEIGLINMKSPGPGGPLMSRGVDSPVFRNLSPGKNANYDLGTNAAMWNKLYTKRVYLSATAYLEVDANNVAHLYGAAGLVVENGDIASAGPQS